jgi:hypothetical protein
MNLELPIDHWLNLENLVYYKNIDRAQAEQLLEGTINRFIIRSCGDVTEFINDRPNPNLFVISFNTEDKNNPGKIIRIHSKVRRINNFGLTFSNRIDLTTKFYSTLSKLINSSSIHMITPYYSQEGF